MNATEASKANGFIGIMMGTIAAIIGVFMILRGKRMRKAGLCHKLKE
jgi:ABC-type Mn2+/Zn2+ transport system permease subunit